MEKLVLIDGNSLLNRAYYATPIFTTKDGNPTNGIFGFIKLLFKIIGDVKPNYLIVAFDLKSPTFRHKIYADYKAGRKGMPEELAVQVEPLKNLLEAMNIATCTKEGIEADDIVGTLSAKFDVHSYIYTGDRDSYQLVDEKTDVYYTKRGVSDLLKLSNENFVEEIGLEPYQVIDLKALMGDKSDNIPGVPGVGEKTAITLLSEYKTLNEIYNNIQSVKGALKDKLIKNESLARMSYKLATIDRNCELDVELKNCVVPTKYSAEVKKIFNQLEFKSLVKMDIFDDTDESLEQEINYPEIIYFSKFEEFKAVVKGKIYIEVSDDVFNFYVKNKQYCVKISENLFDKGFLYDDFCNALRYVFENKENKVVVYDAKNIMSKLSHYDVQFLCEFDDVALMIYLCDYFEITSNFSQFCEQTSYNYLYAPFVISILEEEYSKKLKDSNLLSLYREIELPLVNVLFNMEKEGVSVDLRQLNEFSDNYIAKIKELTAVIYAQCGCEFNINSATQLGDVLFNKIGLKTGKKNKSGKFSTSADVLEKLEDAHPVVKNILLYRLYNKLYSTYIEGLKPLIGKDNVVHTTYNQTVTSTGRLSSANPNLQNIPVREDEGRELRKMFIPKNGNIFIDADYSQIELRLLAHFSRCEELVSAFINNEDIHSVTAAQIFDVDIDSISSDMRRTAKVVNFGIIYGMSEYGLTKTLNISVKAAREYIEKYFAKYPKVKEYMQENVRFAKENGYVSTLTGRRRVIREINSPNYNLRQFGERAAMNMPLQGSSADIIKIAMINVDNALKKEGLKSRLILQVHDELILDAPVSEVVKASEILRFEMEHAIKLSVPLTVNVHSGKNWYEAK